MNFTDLQVYKRSKKLFPLLVEETRKYPKDASYLVSQTVRAANSIHANIAEGFARSESEFKLYLRRALGSNNEVLSHIDDARVLGYLSTQDFEYLTNEYTILGKQLYTLRERWTSQT